MKKFLNFGYTDSADGFSVKVLTPELFYETLSSKKVSDIIDRLATMEPDTKAYREQKAKLPAFIFMALCKDGGPRPKAETKLVTHKCIHDYDHLSSDVRSYFENNLRACIDDLDIQLAYITPSGHGLRLVTGMLDGETIPQCQERIANAVHLKRDPKVSDAGRIIFATPERYLLYIDKEKLFGNIPQVEESVFDEEYAKIKEKENATNAKGMTPNDEAVEGNALLSPQSAGGAVSGALSCESGDTDQHPCYAYYNGIPMDKIVKAVIARKATNGVPTTGERHLLLLNLASDIRPLTRCDFNLTYNVLKPMFIAPDFPDSEIRRTINDGLNYSKGYRKNLSPMLISVLSQLKNEEECNDENDRITEDDLPLPALPPVLEKITSCYPENIKEKVVLASLPLFGTIGSGIRFRYTDRRVNSLSFQVCVIGATTSGKGFVAHLKDMIMKKYVLLDKESRKKEEAERRERVATQNSTKRQDKTVYPVRILPPTITYTQLMNRLYDANGKMMLLFNEEVSTLLKALKGQYGDFTDILKQAFDNGEGGKETATDNSPNIFIPIFLNTLFGGTQGKMKYLLSESNIEDGLACRQIIIPMKDNVGEDMPIYKDMKLSDSKLLDSVIDKLESVGMEKEDGCEMLDVTALNDLMNRWIKKQNDEYHENQNREWCKLSYRSAVMGVRAGVLAWYLWGCPAGLSKKKAYESHSVKMRNVLDFAIWVAEMVRLQLYRYTSKQMEDIYSQQNFNIQEKLPREQFISLLPDEFLPNDWQMLCQQLGKPRDTNVHQTLHRLAERGIIERCDDNRHWRKVRRAVSNQISA